MIQLCHLSKSYLFKPIFYNLSFIFDSHKIYALCGPNGAGKTTLLSMIAGALEIDKGDILINKISLCKEPVKAKKQMGFVPDKPSFYPFLSGKEILTFICQVKEIEPDLKSHELINTFELEQYLDTPLSQMSLGTQKKFFIVAGLMANPPIIIMDEPTNSLDEKAKLILCKYLKNNTHKKTILVSTHDSAFIEEICATPIYLKNHPIQEISISCQSELVNININ